MAAYICIVTSAETKLMNEHKCIDKDELLIQTKDNIEKYGLQVIMVQGTKYSPSFAYSIGLYKTFKHPEIICFGLPPDVAHGIINDVADLIRQGKTMHTYQTQDNIFKDSKAEFLPVDERNIKDYFGAAINYYNTQSFPAIQLVWTDRNDKFPWEDNFEERFLYDQPLLDRNAGFKFREAKNLGVFTTRQWLDYGKPILRVVHDNEGDWQFLTGDQMPEDIRLVTLEQLITRDNELNEVFDIDYGQCADREFAGGPWTITKLKEEQNE